MWRMKNCRLHCDSTSRLCQDLKGLKAGEMSRRDLVRATTGCFGSYLRDEENNSSVLQCTEEKFSVSNRDTGYAIIFAGSFAIGTIDIRFDSYVSVVSPAISEVLRTKLPRRLARCAPFPVQGGEGESEGSLNRNASRVRKEIARRRDDRMQPDAQRVLKYPRDVNGRGGDFDRIPVLRETINCANHTTTHASSSIKHTCSTPLFISVTAL